jgi:hypothetical protein
MKRLCVVCICLLVFGMAGAGWAATWYVDRDVRYSGDGTSWTTAFKTIQEGIDAADGITDQVWVMAGTYYLTAPIDVDKHVGIYGGFGGWEMDPLDRDLRNNITTVDGRNTVGCFYVHADAPHIDGFTITHGNASQGGGIRIDAGGISPAPLIEIFNCTIVDNNATGNGGGIYNQDCALATVYCTFSGNSADDGAGIYSIHNIEPEAIFGAVYCTFLENTATGDGGGVYNNSSMGIANSIFAGNSAGNYGGAIYNIDYGGLHGMNDCSFWGNTADRGGGIANISASPTITDCIFWGDSATNGPEIYNESSSPIVTYCDVEGGTGEPWFGTGCIDSDPFFIDPENGDLHLGPYSPCIDAGNGAMPIPDDFEGDARPINGLYDIGADEASILYASPHGTGDCTEGDPCDLQTALTTAQSNGVGDFVCLEPGIYDPNESLSVPFYAYEPFHYGRTGNENYFIGLVGSPYANGPWDVVLDGGGVSQVLYLTSPADLRIQKVTIKNGLGTSSELLGGGVYAACNGTLTIKDCIISDCTMSCLSGEPSGGGIYASAWEKIIFEDNRVSGNRVLSFGDNVWGAGVYLNTYGGQIIVKDDVITANRAMSRGNGAWGGGLCILTYEGDALLSNNIVAENTAESLTDDSWGGGIYFNHAEGIFSLINNTIVGNQAANGRGGGMYFCVGPPTRADIYNNIIWGNTASSSGNDIFNEGPGALYLYYNDYHDVAGPVSGADDNIDIDPQFINGYYGEYHLAPGSACIDVGTASAPDLPMFDRDGDPRMLGAAPDLGADEAHILYVSPGGSGDCTMGNPCGLQTALTTAQDNDLGDLLSLSAGTYDASSGTFTYVTGEEEGYPLMMMGAPGTTPDQVVLDGGGSHRVLDLFDAQCMGAHCMSDFVVQRVTIQNGYQSGEDYDNGGGIRCVGRTHFIAENIIANNTISGLYYAHGGGICAIGAETSICNNLIMDNEAGPAADVTGGGGVALAPGFVIGMPPLTSSRATLRDNTFLDNAVHTAAEGYGGGARLWEDTAVINNVFSGNSVTNILTALGGGLYANYRNVLTHNTIVGNSANALSTPNEYGGGLVCDDLVEVYNNIIRGNTASGNGDDISLWGPDIYGFNNDYHDLDGMWVVSGGNIDQDPLFVDEPGGDFHLQHTSPCIDVGHNGAPQLPAYDFEGDPRVINDVPDMGVDEVRTDTASEATSSSILSASGLGFGEVEVGDNRNINYTMNNITDADIDVGTATNPATPYNITADGCSNTTLHPGDTCSITIRFAPVSEGTFYSSFDVPTDDPVAGTVVVSLSGIGVSGGGSFELRQSSTAGYVVPGKNITHKSGVTVVPDGSASGSGSTRGGAVQSPVSPVVGDASSSTSTAPAGTPEPASVDTGTSSSAPAPRVISSLPPSSQQESEEKLLLEEGQPYDVMAFGEVKVGASDQLKIILSHEEGEVIKVGEIVLPSAPYLIVEDKCSGTELSAGGECAVTVQFTPQSVNNFYDYFLIPTDDPEVGTLRVRLEGKGISE